MSKAELSCDQRAVETQPEESYAYTTIPGSSAVSPTVLFLAPPAGSVGQQQLVTVSGGVLGGRVAPEAGPGAL